MLKTIIRSAVLVLLMFSQYQSQAYGEDACAPTSSDMQRFNLLPYLYHYADDAMDLEAPWTQDLPFKRLDTEDSSYSFGTAKQAHWLRFCLTNSEDSAHELVLSIWPPLIVEFDFYPQQPGESVYHTGISRPFNTRQIDSPGYNFTIDLQPGQTKSFYFRQTATNNAFLLATLWSEGNYLSAEGRSQLSYGIFAGVFLGLVLYNFLLYQSIGRRSALLFVLFSSSLFTLLTFFDGRVSQYVLSDSPVLAKQLMFFFYYLTPTLGVLFGIEFLGLSKFPRLRLGGYVLISIATVVLLVTAMVSARQFIALCTIYTVLTVVYFVFMAGFLIYKGVAEARYFILSQIPLLFSVTERGFYNAGVLSEHVLPFELRTALAGSLILLAYSVGRSMVDEKERAQRLALEQLEISNDLKANYNAELEKEIDSNTAEIKAMYVDLERQAESLQKLDNVKSQFFANISHEFRTPLTLIQGPLQSVLESETDPDKKQTLNGVLRNSQQLQTLIDQILTLSKFDADTVQLKASPNNLADLVRVFVSQFSSLAESEGIELNFKAAKCEIPIFVDVEKFQIILNNLLSNAIKFTEKGGSVTVEVGLVDQSEDDLNEESASALVADEYDVDRYAWVQVRDTGCGIPEAQLPFVFDRYYQSSAGEDYHTGTGIGLALVQELVKLHVGRVEVTSVEGAGTSFRVMLPLGNSHLTASEMIGSTDVVEHYSPSGSTPDQVSSLSLTVISDQRESILVVDDNPEVRAYLKDILKSEYQVLLAADGIQGEAMMEEHLPTVVITDLMMPKRDGLKFIEVMKSKPEFVSTPIIMLTAKAGQEDKVIGLDAAADDYLAKPFDARELKARIKNLVVKRRQLESFYRASASNDPAEQSPDDAFIAKLRNIVEERISDGDFGVEELAAEVFMSTATLRRRLAESSSFTPSGFIRQCRLERARVLASSGTFKTLAQLAHAVGFSQPDYFSRIYKKTFNEPVVLGASASG